jgi:hypothetical protein
MQNLRICHPRDGWIKLPCELQSVMGGAASSGRSLRRERSGAEASPGRQVSQDHRIVQQLRSAREKLGEDRSVREQAAGAHEIARLLVGCSRQSLESEAGVLQDLMLLAFETLRRSVRPGANYEDNLVSLEQIFSCIANYSFLDAEAVVACGAPQLVVSVFATSLPTQNTPTEVNSWLLTEPVLRYLTATLDPLRVLCM